MGDVVSFQHEGEVLVAGEKSDQEWIEAGKVLAGREAKTNRETGEWFNGVKESRAGNQNAKKRDPESESRFSAEEICEQAGIKYRQAVACGRVVELFPTVESQGGLKWSVCVELLRAYGFWVKNVGEPKARENLQALMARAVRGDAHPKDTANEYHKPWTVVDARRAVDVEVGKELRVGHKQAKTVRKELTSAIAKAVADLPPKKAEAIKKVVTAEVERQAKKLENTYADDVNAGINERLKDQLGPLTEARQAALKDAKRSQQIANDRLKGVPGLMTKAEFKLVLNCLHPDRAPADRREKFSEAFAVIKRLEDRTKWDE